MSRQLSAAPGSPKSLGSALVVLFVALGFGGLLLASPPAHAAPSLLELHFLSIGQGDAMLLRTPSGRVVLIDVGPPRAGRIITRYLKKLGIKTIHLVMISHPHYDHYGGWSRIWRNFRIKSYIDPGFPSGNSSYKKLLRKTRKKGIKMYKAQLNQLLDLGGGAKLRILWPGKRFLRHTRSDANSNSIVARLEYGRLRVLLTGDAEDHTEKKLMRGGNIKSHVLKVGHHGSRHSTSRRFLRAVKARFGIISCAKKNVYRHPHKATLRRLRNARMTTYITARHGHIILRSNGRKMWISTRGGSKASGRAYTLQKIAHSEPNSSPSQPPAQRHRLALQNEKGRWIRSRPQGRERYHSTRVLPSKDGYVASRRSKVFHRRSCVFARRISTRNRVYFRSRKAALRRRRPASDCKP